MRNYSLKGLLTLIIIILPFALNAQTRKFEIEDWEKGINKRQPPETVLKALGLKPGMTVAEVGAGTGRMTLWVADRIGDEGKIYANDIDKDGLKQIEQRAKKAGFKNIETITGEVMDPKLPEATMDMVFMINVFHHLDDEVSILKKIIPALKPGGYLAIIDCDPAKTSWGSSHGCTGKEDMKNILHTAGFELVKIIDSLKEDGIYIANPVSGNR